MLNSFNAAYKLMSFKDNKFLNLEERMNLFFIDFCMVPMLLFENYLTNFQNSMAKLT